MTDQLLRTPTQRSTCGISAELAKNAKNKKVSRTHFICCLHEPKRFAIDRATLLHLFGLDAKKLSYKRNGTEQVLVENPQARVVTELLA